MMHQDLHLVEREVGKTYKDYELVEDLSSGEIVLKEKNKAWCDDGR